MASENQQVSQGLCECATWGRDNQSAALILSHHTACPNYSPELEVRELLQNLLDGIEAWASDEDGVHPDCWDAYVKACGACGQQNRPNRT
jgi:hypothetical protein